MQTAAQTILTQLGGSKFIAMTGSRDFVGGATTLQFTIKGRTTNKANKCRIVLNALDLYDVEFYRLNKKTYDCPMVGSVENIYADQLQAVFTQHTGLYTSL